MEDKLRGVGRDWEGRGEVGKEGRYKGGSVGWREGTRVRLKKG